MRTSFNVAAIRFNTLRNGDCYFSLCDRDDNILYDTGVFKIMLGDSVQLGFPEDILMEVDIDE